MKNIAKCRLCKSIIESYHLGDYVTCSCGEISIDGGQSELLVYAKDFANLLRIDDLGNEIVVTVKDDISSAKPDPEGISKLSKTELIDMLDEMVANIERLPKHAMSSPVTNYDLVASLMLISSLFKVDR